MIRKLFLFAGVSFVISIGCIAASAALISQDVNTHGWNMSVLEDGDHVRFKKGDFAKADLPVTKTLAWTGGDSLSVDVPADVVYTQGPTAGITLTGPQALLDRLQFNDGKLTYTDGPERQHIVTLHWGQDGFDARDSDDNLKIVVTAPNVKTFALAGNGDLSLHGYDQKSLDVTLSGNGSINATGHTDALKLTISGDGDADLEGLAIKDADITINGSGDATLAATGKAQVNIAGSGDVDLTIKPTSLVSHISGSGSVNQDGDDDDND